MPGFAGRGGTPVGPPKGTLLLKDIGHLATLDPSQQVIQDGAILVEQNVIQWVGRTADLPAEFQTADTVLSLPHHLILPGLVNTHHHSFQSLTRCCAQEASLLPWLRTLFPAWATITASDLYVSAKLTLALLILSGCTTTSDHVYFTSTDGLVDDTIRAAREIGIRFHPTRGGISVGKSQGGMAPDSLAEDEDAILEDMKRMIVEYHDNSRYSMLRMGLAPATLLQVSKSFLQECAKLARQNPGVRLHTHLAEIQEEVDAIREQHGCSTSDFLESIGWDKNDCWFAHGCRLSSEDIALFAHRGVGIAHCPSSNLRLCAGIAPVREMLDAGVAVSLGTDGAAGNDGSHLLTEARMAMFVQRTSGDPKGMNVEEALHVATQGGAKNLGRHDIGKIAPGCAADFIGWRTDSIGFAGAGSNDMLAALVLCSASLGQVDLSVINGRIVVQDSKLLTIDLQETIKEHRAASARVRAALPAHWRTGQPESGS